MSERAVRRKSGGRDAKRAERQQAKVQTAAYIERKIPYYELLNEESLELIEHNADTVLEEIGIDFHDPEALTILKDAGADVDGVGGDRLDEYRQRLLAHHDVLVEPEDPASPGRQARRAAPPAGCA